MFFAASVVVTVSVDVDSGFLVNMLSFLGGTIGLLGGTGGGTPRPNPFTIECGNFRTVPVIIDIDDDGILLAVGGGVSTLFVVPTIGGAVGFTVVGLMTAGTFG